MKKTSLLAGLALATALAVASPSYSQEPPTAQTQRQSLRYTLEQITSKNPPEDLTKEDCLEAFKDLLGERYESIERAENPITESKKERWIKYWEGGVIDGENYEGASKNGLREILRDYSPEYTPLSPNEDPDKELDSIPGFNVYLLFKYFPWMDYSNLTPRDKKVLIKNNKILKIIF